MYDRSVEAGRGDRARRGLGRRGSLGLAVPLSSSTSGAGAVPSKGTGEVYEVEANSASEREWENWEDEFPLETEFSAFDASSVGQTASGVASRNASGSSTRDRSATIGPGHLHAFGAPDILVDVQEETGGSRSRSKSVTAALPSSPGAPSVGGSGAR